MTTLVMGGTGKTGRLLVQQLLNRGEAVRAIVRSADNLPVELDAHPMLTLIIASVLELSDEDLEKYVDGCTAVASCLGHNLTFRGLFGAPRRLVTESVRRICAAIRRKNPDRPVRFVLMNTAGNSNRDLKESVSFAHRVVITLLRIFLPPHADNEQAADFLLTELGQHDEAVEWVAVRPDSLIDEDDATEYDLFPSPTRDAIFNSGLTSRVNVAHFMAQLITNDNCWQEWKGQMPVIYNQAETKN